MDRNGVRWLAIVGITLLLVGILVGAWSPRAEPLTHLDEYETEMDGELSGWLFLVPLFGVLLILVSVVILVKDLRTTP